MGFFAKKYRKRKCLFLCSGRGDTTLEKFDIQCKALFYLCGTETLTENFPFSVLLVLPSDAIRMPRIWDDELK